MCTDYDGSSEQVQVTGLAAGAVYRFQYYATNEYGDSPGSAILSAASTNLPDSPGAPAVDWSQSGRTSLYIHWAVSSTGNLPEAAILGYLLQMDSGNATFVTVFDGSFKPGVLGHLVQGLTNGAYYSFRVLAINFNGNSEPSEISGFYVCT